jgi:hypothetical protein
VFTDAVAQAFQLTVDGVLPKRRLKCYWVRNMSMSSENL